MYILNKKDVIHIWIPAQEGQWEENAPWHSKYRILRTQKVQTPGSCMI